MAFNKAKALEKAQQLISQGKLKEAVAEFQKIHEKDPADQTALNTLGDLNVRLKNVKDALKFYGKLADVYVKGGFLVRGIAMFKKISKIDPKNISALERLAELYTMQGLMTEARSHYLKLGEALLKDGQTNKALEMMQKLLDLEPDNLQVQARLAALYESHNHKPEAASIYRRMGDRMLFKGEAEKSLEFLEKAAALDPKDTKVFLLQAQALQQTGKAAESLAVLEKVPDLENNPEAIEILVGAKLGAGDTDGAAELAEKQFSTDATNFNSYLKVAKYAAENNDSHRAIEILQKISTSALENDVFNFLMAIRQVCDAAPDSDEATILLIEAGGKAGDQSAKIEGLQRQARLAEKSEDWAKAKETYNELHRVDPGNMEYTQHLKAVREKLGEDVSDMVVLTTGEDGTVAGAPAGITTEELDEETQTYLTSALADIDLFSNYGMGDQALEKSKEVVGRVPNHREANEKMLDLYIGAKDNAGIVEVANRLETIYRKIGNAPRAEELAELATRYGGGAAPAAEEAAPAEATAEAPPAAPETVPTEEVAEAVSVEPVAEPEPEPEPQVITADVVAEAEALGGTSELDLTAEWTSMVSDDSGVESAIEVEPATEVESALGDTAVTFNEKEASEELAFYLNQGSIDQAKDALANYERDFPDEPGLAGLRAQVAAAETPAKTPAEAPAEASVPEATEITLDAPAEPVAADDSGQGFDLVLEEQPQEAEPAASGDFFSDLVGEIDQTLAGRTDLEEIPGSGGELVADVPEPPPAAAAPAIQAGDDEVDELADILKDFKEDLGDTDDEEVEDVETHYNLGIAYKEMGLYEEAISEFQKSVKAAEHQKDYRHVVQSCILLALCFRERSMAKVAVSWYERSLKIPGLDDEAALAIRYDMAEALEEAGDKKQALDTFMEVYGSNVDYRNVGERIRDLQGS